MSSEPDYNFNQPSPSSTEEGVSLHIPFALLTVAIAVLLIQQTIFSFKQKSSLNEAKDNYNKATTSNAPLVDQAHAHLQQVENLAGELLVLAATDDNAKAICNKYGIRSKNATPVPAPAGTPEPPK